MYESREVTLACPCLSLGDLRIVKLLTAQLRETCAEGICGHCFFPLLGKQSMLTPMCSFTAT